ncbi:kinase-like domain-containing protein [Mycena floridula]|nr:kinase-like domain-containing protein [Mycena floridula]
MVFSGPELVALVDDFLAEVSLSEADSSTGEHVVDALRAVVEEYFSERSTRTHKLILRACTLLKAYPPLVRYLNVFLQALSIEERVTVVTSDHCKDLLPVELIVISGPSGGQIYDMGAVRHNEPSRRARMIASSDDLRMILDTDSLDSVLTQVTPFGSWARALAELLQNEIKWSFYEASYKTLCLRYLRRLTKQHGILPPSFFIHDVVLDGLNPVSGGESADVFKGVLNTLPICLKRLRIFTTQTAEIRERLLKKCCREAILWRQLDHPNVLPFLGVSLEVFAPSFCLVSPWMSNGNLREYVQLHPDFNRLNAIRDIASGMQYLHGHIPPIVHADIRGHNVLVTNDLRCCLADFGLSSITEGVALTNNSSSNRGSFRWLAPEIILPSADVKQLNRSTRDIYAFGCTILEVYTGQHPFSQYIQADAPVILDVIAGRRPRRPLDVFSDWIWDLVEQCWHQDPERRPTARAIVEFLQPGSTKPLESYSSTPVSPRRERFNVNKPLPIITESQGNADEQVGDTMNKKRPGPLKLLQSWKARRADERGKESTQDHNESQESIDRLGGDMDEALESKALAGQFHRSPNSAASSSYSPLSSPEPLWRMKPGGPRSRPDASSDSP